MSDAVRRLIITITVLAPAGAGVGCSPAREESRATPPNAAPSKSPEQPTVQATESQLPRTSLTLQDRERWRRVLAWPEECESAFQTSHASEDAGLTFSELSPGLSLVHVLCAAGSYQPSFVYIRFDERAAPPTASVLRFPLYETQDGTSVAMTRSSEVWGEATFLPEARELTVLHVVRQTGDCGIWTRYHLGDGDDGASPAVAEARALLPCPARPRDPAVSQSGQPPRGWRPIRQRQ